MESMTDKIEPLRITIEFYNKKISTEVDHSDLTLEDLHDMWIEIVKQWDIVIVL